MLWFRNLRIRKKISIVIGIMLFIIFTNIAISGYYIVSMNRNINKVNLRIITPLKSLEEINRINFDNNINLKRLKYIKDVKESSSLLKIILSNYNNIITEYEIIEDLNKSGVNYDNIFRNFDFYSDKIKNYKKTGFKGPGIKFLNDLININENEIKNIVKLKQKIIFSGNKTILSENKSYDIYLKIIVIVISISLILTIIISLIFSTSITKPINKGLVFAKNLASGDFTDRINIDRRDELGELCNALNQSAIIIEDIITEIFFVSKNLDQTIGEIGAGNDNLSQRTTEQASSLEEIATAVNQITNTVNQNAENAKVAYNLSGDTTKLAIEGGEITEEAIGAIHEVSESSKKIKEIISVIDGIAFQTNLLALNAAVEAARAGESGRGFAVVAGEVRNLAQRSANAAKEIKILISDSLDKINRGTELSNQSGESLNKIIGSVKYLENFISQIADASDEQRNGMQQVNTAIVELEATTQQNAGLVEETSSSSEGIGNLSKELVQIMNKFSIKGSDDLKNDPVDKKKDQKKNIEKTETKKTETIAVKEEKSENYHDQVNKNNDDIEKILTNDGYEKF